MFTGRIEDVGTYHIARLDLGTLTVPAGTPMGGRVLPVHAFIVLHPRGPLLFDTGLGAEDSTFDPLLTPVRRPLEEALRAHKLSPTDFTAVVNCHLHYDHCGGNPLFPGIPTFIPGTDLQAGQNLGFYLHGRVEYPGVDLRHLEGEHELLPGLRIIPTPGHTPGHQSLVIDDAEAPVILAGQAAYTVDEFVDPEAEPARGSRTAWNAQEFLKSISLLKALNPRRVYFAHDARAWDATI
jgi:N-acyl homoserine lactone hydrolase